tara:strand:- start:1800 stop:2231 length:432 start_codon:yes stop_codon:yes gene_type:complete
MRKINRSALVPYSAMQMYELVGDFQSYPEFLPWCTNAILHASNSNYLEASLEFQRNGLTKSFRTKNTLNPGSSIEIELIDGPFRHLAGKWSFVELTEDGSKVVLNFEFEFKNQIIDKLFGSYFEDTCNSLVSSFTSRAKEVYG